MKRESEKLRGKLLQALEDFISELDTKGGMVHANEDDVVALQTMFDDFYKKHTRPFIALLAYKITKALRAAVDEFDADVADVRTIEKRLGIEDGKVKSQIDGKSTVLYSMAMMGAIRTDLSNMFVSSLGGGVAQKDMKKHMAMRASRRYHDFFDTYVLSSLMQSYSAARIKFAKQQGYNKFLYVGGLVDESRDFCIERAGHEFTIEEGESWNDMWWKGKIEGVDFFVQIGGYNCGHYLEFIKDEERQDS